MPGRTKPLEKFGEAIGKCATEVSISATMIQITANPNQGVAYGKCVAAEYQNARKDMCVQEFMRLKDCYLVSCFYLVSDFTSLTPIRPPRGESGNMNSRLKTTTQQPP